MFIASLKIGMLPAARMLDVTVDMTFSLSSETRNCVTSVGSEIPRPASLISSSFALVSSLHSISNLLHIYFGSGLRAQ